MDGATEALAASVLCDKNDPTRLTWRELKDGWGGCAAFVIAYGLKPHDTDDLEEALSISRGLKAAQ